MQTGPLVFVLGGARSGKSLFAEKRIAQWPAPWTYVATAQAFDDEMAQRISDHRARRDARWTTVEAPHDLAACLARETDRPMLVDCLTLWLSNRLLAEADLEDECTVLVAALRARKMPTLVVSNEVGLGLVPETRLGRAFRDAAGRLNQRVAAVADEVHFVAAGLGLRLK
jgi:adenosylcobinamide kinase/adenosylcobinamide-phosphate guanylyltransferase